MKIGFIVALSSLVQISSSFFSVVTYFLRFRFLEWNPLRETLTSTLGVSEWST
jgi:hypothetical protein